MPTKDYRLKDGTRVSGVTTINKNVGWSTKALVYSANRLGLEGKKHEDVWGKEMSAGTVAHAMIEIDLKEDDTEKKNLELDRLGASVSEDIRNSANGAFISWLEWKERMQFKIYKTELSLVSEIHKFGGTIDWLPYLNNKLSIFDFKTGKSVYEDALLQVAAYKELTEENGIETPGGIHILNLGKERASFKHIFFDALPEAWEAFLNAKNLHNLHKLLKKMV